MVVDGGVFEPGEIIAEIAEVGQQDGANEFAVAAGETVDDVALRADDGAQAGEIAADGEELVDEFFLGGIAGEDAFFELLELGAEFVHDRLVVVDEMVEQGVGEAIGAAGGAFGDALERGGDGAQGAR